MANPFDFTAGAVLTAAQLNQIGDFESFSPSWTNLTVGDATQEAKFAQVNEIVYFQVEFIAGSSSSFGSGSAHQFALPVTPVTDLSYTPMGTGWCRPDGGNIFMQQLIGVGSNCVPYCLDADDDSSAYTGLVSQRNSVPQTWNTSGQMYMAGWYRVA